tara:strand:- start:2865 stop:3287 length:423 start_codon:yes stop_codon:yes gene_type:complete
MADGNGTKLASRASNEEGAYMFNMNDSSASSHSLDMGDSGKIYMVYSTVARTITLPAVAAGLKFKFIMSDTTADSSIVTNEGTALIKGGAECGDAYLTLAGTTIVLEAEGSVGDHLEFICDGTYWYVSGHGAHDASFSVS